MVRTTKREYYSKIFIDNRGYISTTWKVIHELVPDRFKVTNGSLAINKVNELISFFTISSFSNSRQGVNE